MMFTKLFSKTKLKTTLNKTLSIAAIAVLLVPLLSVLPKAASADPNISEYSLPSNLSSPMNIVSASDGAVWFKNRVSLNSLGRITTSGSISSFSIPSNDIIEGLTPGIDGALWFAVVHQDNNVGGIGRMTTSGQYTEYPLPPNSQNYISITSAPDGSIWFTQYSGYAWVGHLLPDGTVHEYTVGGTNDGITGITVGPDGNVWFTYYGSGTGKIGELLPNGSSITYNMPSNSSAFLMNITDGPDGAMWFTDEEGSNIGRITTSGSVTIYPLPTAQAQPEDITRGPDGALWFTEIGANKIGRIDTAGNISEYSTAAGSEPYYITSGSDGAIWFTETGTNKIGRLSLGPSVGMVSGTVTVNSIPIYNALVEFGPYTTRTDVNGHYSIASVQPYDGYTAFVSYDPSSTPITPGIPYSFTASSQPGYVNVNGNTSRDLAFTTSNQTIHVVDANGQPITGSLVSMAGGAGSGQNSATYNFSDGTDGESYYASGIYSQSTTDANGNVSIPVFAGITYLACANTDTSVCKAVTADPNTPATITLPAKTPAAPTNLAASSPTLTPSLSWGAVSGATSYNVYRDGSLLYSSNSNTYTDMSATSGVHSYYVTAVNSAGESSPSNTIQVSVGVAPAITSANSATTGQRTPFSFTVTTTGDPTASVVESGNLPSGISFTDNGDGTATIAGEAAAGTNGSYPITFTADNGLASPATQNFTLTVDSSTSSPIFTSDNNDTESFGVPFSFNITTEGFPAPAITKSSGTLPAGVTFVDNGDGTATLSGTPTNAALGVYNLKFKAKSSAGTVYQTFTLTITKAPVLPKVSTQTLHVGTAYTKTFKAKGYNTPSLSESGTLPAGLTFVDNGDGSGTLAGTPQTGSGGSYSVTITATNPFGSSSQTFTVKVNEGPAITSANSATATRGQAFSFQLTSTGFPSPTYSKIGTLPAGLTFHGSTGIISGTPNANSAGTYNLTITAKNSTGSVTQTFTLVVN